MEKLLLLGVHLSISGGIKNVFQEAKRLKINCFQIFLGSPRLWDVKEPSEEVIKLAREEIKNFVFSNVHAPYLLNLATDSDVLFDKSIKRAIKDIMIMSKMGIKFYVVHPGSTPSVGGPKKVRTAIAQILERTKEGVILIENLSGEKNDVGKNLDELEVIIEGFGERIGICLDTCHLFASGVDIRDPAMLDKFYQTLKERGLLDKIMLIHANDSKKKLGSQIDRHEHIGEGEIGKEGFFNLLHHPFFKKLPFILETPKEDNADEKNLLMLKSLFNAKKI